jgi:uncharacterized protein with GYD domain
VSRAVLVFKGAAPSGRAGALHHFHHQPRRGKAMAHYVTLISFTEQGARNIKETIKRTEAARQAGAAMGVTIKEALWTQGQYDLVVISESDDEIAANAFVLNAVKAGNIRTQVMRAFTAAEMQKILDKVG